MAARWAHARAQMHNWAAFFRALAADAAQAIARWSWRRWLGLAILLGTVALAALFLDVPEIATVRQWADNLGPWFMVAFWCGYCVLTLFPLPRTTWTLAAGILFGPWWGLAISLTALTVSAAISFSVVRFFLGPWIAPRLEHPAVAGINERLKARGWLAIISLRMIAGVPFSLLNYVAALTSISLRHFTVATAVGSVPTTVLGVVFGDALVGGPQPWLVGCLVALAGLGIAGLILDSRLAVRGSH